MNEMNEFYLISPELWIAVMASLILIIDVFLPKQQKNITFYLSQFTLIVAFILSYQLLGQTSKTIFYRSFISDNAGVVIKLFIYLLSFFVFWYTKSYIQERNVERGEYFVLCLFSILGMMILVSAGSFLTLYLGLELFALPLYALVAFIKESESGSEAAMKYFVMGAMVSGMLLYGISLLYGATGSFEISEVARLLLRHTHEPEPQLAIMFGLMFIIVGLAFKFGAVPFHLWIPDVYQGSPTSVTLFIGTLPKLASFGMAIRLFMDALPSLHVHWESLFAVLAVLSLAIGNIAAIAQTNLKRMLAYSTIGHVGFIFLGLLSGPHSGYAPTFDYVIIYAIMALGAFGIIMVLSKEGSESDLIEDFKGLSKREPIIAFMMLLILLSLTGIPPLAGFYAKFIVLNALINAGHTWLAVLGVLFSVIGAYYYLRVIKVMYFDEPLIKTEIREDSKVVGQHYKNELTAYSSPSLSTTFEYEKVNLSSNIVTSIVGLSLLLLGIFPAPLYNLCIMALRV